MTGGINQAVAVGDLIHGPAEVMPSRSSIAEVITRLGTLGIGMLVIMDEAAVIGVVSERDVVWALAEGADPLEIWADDIMTRDLVMVEPSTKIVEAASIMRRHQVRHLLVSGSPVPGVVSLRDVIEHLID